MCATLGAALILQGCGDVSYVPPSAPAQLGSEALSSTEPLSAPTPDPSVTAVPTQTAIPAPVPAPTPIPVSALAIEKTVINLIQDDKVMVTITNINPGPLDRVVMIHVTTGSTVYWKYLNNTQVAPAAGIASAVLDFPNIRILGEFYFALMPGAAQGAGNEEGVVQNSTQPIAISPRFTVIFQ